MALDFGTDNLIGLRRLPRMRRGGGSLDVANEPGPQAAPVSAPFMPAPVSQPGTKPAMSHDLAAPASIAPAAPTAPAAPATSGQRGIKFAGQRAGLPALPNMPLVPGKTPAPPPAQIRTAS